MPGACAADLLAQAEHGADSEALLLSTDPVLSETVSRLVSRYDNVVVRDVASVDEALARSEAFAPEHLELHVRDPEALLARVRNAGSVFVGGSAVLGDYAAGATHVLPTGGLARSSGGLGLEMFMKPLQVVRATAAGAAAAAAVVGPIARAEGLPLHAAAAERSWRSHEHRRMARPTPTRSRCPTHSRLTPGRRASPRSRRGMDCSPRRCSSSTRTRRRSRASRRCRWPRASPRSTSIRHGAYRELREAAAGYVRRQTGVEVGWEQVVVGAGADDLILLCARTYLGPGRTASVVSPTYSLYRVATLLAGAEPVDTVEGVERCSGAATPTTRPAR